MEYMKCVYKDGLHIHVTCSASGKYVCVMGAGLMYSTAQLYLLHYTTVARIWSIHAHLA